MIKRKMTKQERKIILIGVGVVIVALLILLIVNGVRKKGDEDVGKTNTQVEQNAEKYTTNLEGGTKLNKSEEFNKNKKYKSIEISNIQFTYENGKSVLLATVKNTASTKHASEIVKLTILGENNQVIDEVNAIIPDMQAGETKQLNATISGADSVNAKDESKRKVHEFVGRHIATKVISHSPKLGTQFLLEFFAHNIRLLYLISPS